MSRGPGRIEQAIEAAFTVEPDNAFTVDDLIERAFSGVHRVEKKHRVSVIRAAKKVAGRMEDYCWDGYAGGQLVFFNHASVASYAMARLKDNMNHWNDIRTEEECRAMLAPGGKHHDRILPGGFDCCIVERYLARKCGDNEKADSLNDDISALMFSANPRI